MKIGKHTNHVGLMQKKEITISKETKEKAEIAKMYIQEKYQKLLEDERKKKEQWDKLVNKMKDMNLTQPEQQMIKQDIFHQEAQFHREKRTKLSPKDFKPINIIGRGAFGEVRLCRWYEKDELVAIKKMKKSDMIKKNQIQHIRAERDVLAQSNIPWIVDQKCSFHDENHLYLVMEYLPGGDLMSLLMRKDILSEEEGRFYMAQSVLSVEAVHKVNYVHRDLKPDNILIDVNGHIKLSDFGLCKYYETGKHRQFPISDKRDVPQNELYSAIGHGEKKQINKNKRQRIVSQVGTPDYIAPEVFGKEGYTETVDWWSLGAILFEMLVGYPPFFAENPSATCKKVLDWRNSFVIPKEARLSREATDLLKRLICDHNQRLGINGVEELKAHPFFRGVNWDNIRDTVAPNIPQLKHPEDTSGFDEFPEIDPWNEDEIPANKSRKHKKNRVNDVHFIGYTYKRSLENQKIQSIANLFEEIDNTREQALIDQKLQEDLRSGERMRKKTSEQNDSQKVMKKKNSQSTKNNNFIESTSNYIKNKPQNLLEEHKMTPEDQQQCASQKEGVNMANVFREKQSEQEKALADQLSRMQQNEREKLIVQLQKATENQNKDQRRFTDEINIADEEPRAIAAKYVNKPGSVNKELNKSNSPINKMNTNSQKLMFTSSMLKYGSKNKNETENDNLVEQKFKEVSYDKNIQQASFANNKGALMISNTNKNGQTTFANAIQSTGNIKKEPNSMFASNNTRSGGSPNTIERSNIAKSSNQIKMNAGNFFNKDNKKTAKSPSGGELKKNIGGDKSKDKTTANTNTTKKAFNMQFNEYMNKQKNSNHNFQHSGKATGNPNPTPPYYKLGNYSQKNNNNTNMAANDRDR